MLVLVAVVKVREMGVAVDQGLMAMGVAVRLPCRVIQAMLMPVMLVMHVPVLMLQDAMGVLMLVRL